MDRQADRQTDRHTDTQADTHTHARTQRERGQTDGHRQTDRQADNALTKSTCMFYHVSLKFPTDGPSKFNLYIDYPHVVIH